MNDTPEPDRTANDATAVGFSAEERAAMKERAKELVKKAVS
jgi:hypothetical protein